MESNGSYMQLLAAVGQIAIQRVPSSLEYSEVESFEFYHNVLRPLFSETQISYPTMPEVADGLSESRKHYCTDEKEGYYMFGGGSGCYSDSDDGELDEAHNVEEYATELVPDEGGPQLPNDPSVLYDYDFAMSDSERKETYVPEITPTEEPLPKDNKTWKKRKRHAKGVVLPNCRKSSGIRAVETAMRNSANRSTIHIFQPSVGMTFDSLAEAHNFYKLYSWEIGFGIRYGNSHTNKVNEYHLMQELECVNADEEEQRRRAPLPKVSLSVYKAPTDRWTHQSAAQGFSLWRKETWTAQANEEDVIRDLTLLLEKQSCPQWNGTTEGED